MRVVTLLFFYLLLVAGQRVAAQEGTASQGDAHQGSRLIMVMDTVTRKPLSFASAVYRDTRKGFIADVDGNLRLPYPLGQKLLTISRIGYRSKRINASELPDTVYLAPNEEALQSVVVHETDESDPRAEWIIRQSIHNKPMNNPDQLAGYTYTSYNKMVADTTVKVGASDIRPDNKHLFVLESVINHAYRKPALRNETVEAQKVSGLKNGYFLGLATQLQYFSFYPDEFSLLGIKYSNPVSQKYRGNYVFHLVDSLRDEDGQLTWIISFRPRRNKFGMELLKGQVNIHEGDFGIVNVIASPSTINTQFNISFRQQYTRVKEHWFPAQLNTDISVFPPKNDAHAGGALIITTRSYLRDIGIDSIVSARHFGNYQYSIAPDANDKPSSYWDSHRTIPLDTLDTRAYHYLDSITTATPQDKAMSMLVNIGGDLAKGQIPAGKINLVMSQIVKYNGYEGFRLGVGFISNDKLSRDWRFGANVGYGTIDRSVKYGGLLEAVTGPDKDVFYGVRYARDIELAGANSFAGTPIINVANLYSTRADSLQIVEIYRKGWVGKVIQSRFFINYQDRVFTEGYHFLDPVKQTHEYNGLHLVEAGAFFHTDFKQGLLKTPFLTIDDLSPERTNYLELELKVGESVDAGSSVRYQKTEARYTRVFSLGRPGKLQAVLEGGKVFGHLPYSMLFSGLGTYEQFALGVPGTFQTMRRYEFINDAYAGLFLNYETGYLVQRRGKFGLSLDLAQNTGIGSLSLPQLQIGLPARPMSEPYTEAGIGFRLRTAGNNYHIMVYYRYGTYELPKTGDNFSFRVTIF